MVRGMEITADVADSPRSVIVEQVTNGVAVRMAVLYLLLGGSEPAVGDTDRRPKEHDAMTTLPDQGRRDPRRRAHRPAAPATASSPTSTPTARPSRTPRSIDADGLIALPGLVDLHTHLREPGREDAETVETGTQAAALGGFTAVHAMANTDPVADTAGVVEQVWRLGREAGYCDVLPGRRGHRRAGGRAARRARRDGRLGRPGAGLLRRRQVRERRGADAPGAGVRQGVRRRRSPSTPRSRG